MTNTQPTETSGFEPSTVIPATGRSRTGSCGSVREQTLSDVIGRTETRAEQVLELAEVIKAKLYKSDHPNMLNGGERLGGMIGDVDAIETILNDVYDVLAVVSERLA